MQLVTFLIAITKGRTENTLKEELFWITVFGETAHHGGAGKAAGSQVRSRGKSKLVLSFLLHRMLPPSPGWVFPPELELSGNVLPDTLRMCFLGDCVSGETDRND